MDEKYYIFVTPDNVIWGVGTTIKAAVEDAKLNITNYDDEEYKPKLGKVMKASYELAWAIWDFGYDENMWELYKDGESWMAVLKDNNTDYYKQLKNIKETKLKFN
jgi:hypothetical protein